MNMKSITYKEAGVDISWGNEFVRKIKPLIKKTFRPGVIGGIGGFSGLFRIEPKNYKDPVLVSSTDGVGTKLKIAFMMNRHDTVGIDLVAMGVNDILVHGAEPLFFLDYMATGKLRTDQAIDIVKGIIKGCREAECALLGGETAEMPSLYKEGEYDLAGFVVGIVEKKRILDGSKIKPGDVLIGLASSGLHSNGFSLARKLFFEKMRYKVNGLIKGLKRPLGKELLCPTSIYVKPVLKLLKEYNIKGMSHITGGGITENLPRILPDGASAVIKKGSWKIYPIFKIIQEMGNVSEKEMYRTFNMGIGFILVVSKKDADSILRRLKRLGEKAYVIGRIAKGKRGVRYV
ncbi:MAG: phosphoribosylformylglycinamidine cyclo-ligase [Nitrospirota bacterium]